MTTLIQCKVIGNEKSTLFKSPAVYFSLETTLLRAAGHLENFPSCLADFCMYLNLMYYIASVLTGWK